MILPRAPDGYDRKDQDQLRHALEIEFMRLQLSRALPRVRHLVAGVTTTSTGEVSLTSVTIPGGTLRLDGEQLHARIGGVYFAAGAGSIVLKFGTETLLSYSVPVDTQFEIVFGIARTTATAQNTIIRLTKNKTDDTLPETHIYRKDTTRTLASDLLLDFRGSVFAGGILSYDAVSVEYLTTTTQV